FAGTARIGSASAARISAAADSVAATPAPADTGAAARRLLRRVRLLESLGGAGIAVERHVVAGEVPALVGRDRRAGCGREHDDAAHEGASARHGPSLRSASISRSSALDVSAVNPRCT